MLFSLVAEGENINVNVNIASSEKQKKTKKKTKEKNQPRVQKCCESVFSFPDILLNN